MLKAVVKTRAFEDVVKQIRGLVEKKKLKQGDQLPSGRELSETLRVSRATVREAITALEAMLLVERRQGEGTYVVASGKAALSNPLAAALFQQKDDLIEIFAVRKLLEPGMAEQAAVNATPEEIAELEKIVRDQEEAAAQGKDPFQNDSHFQLLLARMCRSPVLERLFLALVGLLNQSRGKYLESRDYKQKCLELHRNVLDAIRQGDPAAARLAVRLHLEEVEGALFQKKRKGAAGTKTRLQPRGALQL